MSALKKEAAEELLFMSAFGPISNAKLHETFDVLPNLIDVLKDIQAASAQQETTRIGDVSASVCVGYCVVCCSVCPRGR